MRTALDDTTPAKFLIDHPLWFESCNGARDFGIKSTVPIIAVTERNVVLFALHPTFTRMNRDEVFLQALFNTFLARNVAGNNLERFNGKRVSVCVFTFSSDAPVWLHMDYEDAADTPIRDCIAAALRQRFRGTNDALWAAFQECLRSSPDGLLRTAFETMEKLLASRFVPDYVWDFFKDAKERSKKERRCVVQGVDDINAALDKRIREFMYPDDSVW